MDFLRFFLNHKKLVSFGFLLAFFSSFGQTFLISLYVPGIIREFHLTGASFGTLYGAATILSGLALAYAGQFIDRCNLRNYTLLAVFLLILSCCCIAFSSHLVFVFAGFWGLRFAGQGLLSHISNTSISKFFDHRRGTALSLSVMGYSVGEACFPLIIGCLIGWVGWRSSMLVSGLLIGLTLVPFVFFALHDKRLHHPVRWRTEDGDKAFSSLRLWFDKRFQIIAINMFILPFMITGLFFYHLVLAEQKGWSLEWLTASFLGFALGRTFFSLISGKLIDRFSSLALFPYHLVPFLAALCVLILFDHPLAAPVYLTLTGVAMGLSSTIKTALLAEVYGTENLGSIRAMSATVMVFSTALSPALFGFLLDRGIDFTIISAGAACVVLAIIIISGRLPYLIRTVDETASSKQLCETPA